uniref:Uncharacterized protein n=1 Tax=Aegilops tauschii subsp. strangulata TaxID=200361 RepID=A0A453EZI8_AEGTS
DTPTPLHTLSCQFLPCFSLPPAPPRCSPPEAARAASIATLRSIGDAAAELVGARGGGGGWVG